MKKRIGVLSLFALVVICIGTLISCNNAVISPIHNHSYTYSIVRNEENSRFDLVGKCSADGCTDTDYLEENINLSVESETPATCFTEGEIVLFYVKAGVAVEYKISTPKLSHKLSGVEINELLSADGTVDSTVAGVTVPDGASCGQTVSGSFVCDLCNTAVGVKVHLSHSMELQADASYPADCISDGVEKYACARCDKTEEKLIVALGHKYEARIYPTAEGFYNIDACCRREGCSDCLSVLGAREVALTEEILPTCSSEGSVKYSYVKDSALCYVNAYLPRTEHKLAGRNISEYLNGDGYVLYGTEGVSLPLDATVKCGKTLQGKYLCSACEEEQSLTVYVDHDAEDYVVVTEPTCDTDGEARARCGRCYGGVVKVVPALGHLYNYSVTLNSDGGFNLTGVCIREGCSDPHSNFVNIENLSRVYHTEPTCTGYGKTVYESTFDGNTVTYTSYEPKVMHRLEGAVIEDLLNPDGSVNFGVEGITLDHSRLKCGEITEGTYRCADCGDTVTIPVYVVPHHIESEEKWVRIEPNCISDGSVTKSCKYCDYEDVEIIYREAGRDYHVMKWSPESHSFSDYPTTTFKGTCKTRGCVYSVSGRVADENSYSSEITTPATCDNWGTRTHSWKILGEVVTDEEPIIPPDHRVLDNDGKEVFVSTLMNENGHFNINLDCIGLVGGTVCPCGGTCNGYYFCIDCEKSYTVTVYRDHVWKEIYYLEAGCETDGKRIEKCEECQRESTTTLLKSHVFDYVYDEATGEVVKSCIRGDVNCSFVTERIPSSLGTFALKEITTAPTCDLPGEGIYEFTYSMAGEPITVLVKKTLAKAGHFIYITESEYVDVNALKLGEGNILPGAYGIIYPDGVSAPTCGKPFVNCCFICAECEETVDIMVGQSHTYYYEMTKTPTCLEDGLITTLCRTCNFSSTESISGIHSYVHLTDRGSKPGFDSEGEAVLECKFCENEVRVVLPKIKIGTNSEIIGEGANPGETLVKYTCRTEYGVTVVLEISIAVS